MSITRKLIVAVALSLIGWLAPVGLASADCTTPGDFGAGSGCAPPSSGSGNTESWPPTSVDWPPQLKSDSDSDSDSKGSSPKSTPIVMPDGQKPPATAASSDSTSTSTPATPIVPAGPVADAAATTSATATPIVTPQH